MTEPIGGETITIRRAALVTDGPYGARRRDWGGATTTVVGGCSVQPYGQPAEVTAGREFTSTHLRLFAPYGIELAAADRVEYAGTTFEVDGEPDRWRDEYGNPDHTEAALRRLAG